MEMEKKKRNAKGEGHYKHNQNGTVTLRKSVGFQDGKKKTRKILTVTAPNKAACIRMMKKKEAEWEKQKNAEKLMPGTTVAEICKLHLQSQVRLSELKPKSIDRRECTIHNHIEKFPIGSMQAQSIKPPDIEEHITKLIQSGQLSASSVEKTLDVLNAAYKWVIMRGELGFNPVTPVKSTLEKRISKMKQRTANEADVKVFSEEEQKMFEREALLIDEKTGKYRYEAGLYGMLLLHTGMRCGEMLALRWKDVDFQNGLLNIEKSRSMARNRDSEGGNDNKYTMVEGLTKNEKARVIKLTDEALDILHKILAYHGVGGDDENELIVKTRTGKPNTATNLEHRMATIYKNIGLDELKGELHIFRRTFATRMYENGARVKEIAAYIGDLESTTERYYIAVRKKVIENGKAKQVVMVPGTMAKQDADNI